MLASISPKTASQVHPTTPGRLMRDRSHRDLSGKKKYSATRWNYDRFMSPESANFGTPYKIHLRFFSKKSTRTRPGPPRTRPGPPRPARDHS